MAFNNTNKRRMGNNRKKKVCAYCPDKTDEIDYKDVNKLSKFVSDRGKILPRRVTGACAIHQRAVTRAVKKSRVVGLMSFIRE